MIQECLRQTATKEYCAVLVIQQQTPKCLCDFCYLLLPKITGRVSATKHLFFDDFDALQDRKMTSLHLAKYSVL